MEQVKKNITVSIMPTYKCKNGCNYCYLTEIDKESGEPCWNFLNKLYKKLNEVVKKYKITTIELYGGDLSLVQFSMLKEIVSICRCYCKNIHVTWGDIEKAHELGFSDEQINISINPERRDFLDNVCKIKKNPNLGAITVVTPTVLNFFEENILNWYNEFNGNITFMPFNNKSITPVSYVTNYSYSHFMIRILSYYFEHRSQYNFNITNIIMLRDCLKGLYSPAMRNNIFITPSGNFACVDFDDIGVEYFYAFPSLDLWEQRCSTEEIDRVQYCGTCENYLNCMAEHFKTPSQISKYGLELGDTCNGYPLLVQWCKEHPEWI